MVSYLISFNNSTTELSKAELVYSPGGPVSAVSWLDSCGSHEMDFCGSREKIPHILNPLRRLSAMVPLTSSISSFSSAGKQSLGKEALSLPTVDFLNFSRTLHQCSFRGQNTATCRGWVKCMELVVREDRRYYASQMTQ